MLFSDITPLLPVSGLKKFLNMQASNSYEIGHFPAELHGVISNVDDCLLNYTVSYLMLTTICWTIWYCITLPFTAKLHGITSNAAIFLPDYMVSHQMLQCSCQITWYHIKCCHFLAKLHGITSNTAIFLPNYMVSYQMLPFSCQTTWYHIKCCHFPSKLHGIISNAAIFLPNYMVSHRRRENINIHYYENFKSHISATYYRRICRKNYNCKFSGGETDSRIGCGVEWQGR